MNIRQTIARVFGIASLLPVQPKIMQSCSFEGADKFSKGDMVTTLVEAKLQKSGKYTLTQQWRRDCPGSCTKAPCVQAKSMPLIINGGSLFSFEEAIARLKLCDAKFPHYVPMTLGIVVDWERPPLQSGQDSPLHWTNFTSQPPQLDLRPAP